MVRNHTDEDEEKSHPTDADGYGSSAGDVQTREKRELTDGAARPTRRSILKMAGVAGAAVTLGSALGGSAMAAPSPGDEVDSALSPDGELHLPAGEYVWNGSGLDIGSGAAVVGDGDPGDVVFNLESGTMEGTLRGRLENVVVRGENPEPKAGIDLYRGCVLDGFVWPEGGTRNEDRALYTPADNSGSDRLTVRNSAWAMMGNNGAYCDNIPGLYENCASVNNNVAGIRVGHQASSDPLSETTEIRNCLVAAVSDVPYDAENGTANARGIRVRQNGHIVIENCYFLYRDVEGATYPIDVEDDVPDSVVEIRDCVFYNETDNPVIIDETGGEADITVENCVAAGPGNHGVDVDGVPSDAVTSVESVEIPTPAAITGYAAANDVPGVEPGTAPWSDTAPSAPSDGGSEPEPTPDEHTIVLHADPENTENIDVSFVVDGDASYGSEAESDTDLIETADDGTTTVTSVSLNPDALDSYRLTGPVVDYSVSGSGSVDISFDGTTTTFAELVGETDSTDGGSGDGGSGDGGSNDSGSGDGGTNDSGSSDGGSKDSGSDDGSKDSGSDDGSKDSGSDDGGSKDGGSDDGSLPNTLAVDGSSAGCVTEYTFTVTGDVARDPDASEVRDDGTPWDSMKDIARDGKVIGAVGSGVDAYQFSGDLTALTVDGDADVSIDRGK